MSALPPDKRDLPVQDTLYRQPEWESLQYTYGAGPTDGTRDIQWDPIHGWVKNDGPVYTYHIGQDRTRPY